MKTKSRPITEEYMSLVKKLYREERIRPLSKALAKASKEWVKTKSKHLK